MSKAEVTEQERSWWKVSNIGGDFTLEKLSQDSNTSVSGNDFLMIYYNPDWRSSLNEFSRSIVIWEENLLGQMVNYLKLKLENKDLTTAKGCVERSINILKSLRENRGEFYYYNIEDILKFEELQNEKA